MRPPMGGQMGGPGGGQEAMQNVDANRSMLNPTDGAMALQEGKIRPDMTFGEFCQTNMGIAWDEPLQSAIPKLQKQMQNRSSMGKMENISQGAGRPPGGMPPGQEPGMEPGLDTMMKQMR